MIFSKVNYYYCFALLLTRLAHWFNVAFIRTNYLRKRMQLKMIMTSALPDAEKIKLMHTIPS